MHYVATFTTLKRPSPQHHELSSAGSTTRTKPGSPDSLCWRPLSSQFVFFLLMLFTPVRSFYFFPADQLPLELYANAFTPDPFNWQHGEVQPPHVTCVPLRSFGAPVLRTHSATAEPCLDCTNRSSKLNPPINSITGRGHFYHPYHVSFRPTFVTHHPLIRTPTPTLSAGAFVSFTTHTNPRVTERKWESMFSWYLSNRLVERGVKITNHKPIFPTKKINPLEPVCCWTMWRELDKRASFQSSRSLCNICRSPPHWFSNRPNSKHAEKRYINKVVNCERAWSETERHDCCNNLVCCVTEE